MAIFGFLFDSPTPHPKEKFSTIKHAMQINKIKVDIAHQVGYKYNMSKKEWKAVTLRLPQLVSSRVDKMLKAKPHYTQQAIIIDAILAGLAEVEAKEAVR